jgi:hypothetical protein
VRSRIETIAFGPPRGVCAGEAARQQDGIALYYSIPSIHGASILGYHQRNTDDDDEASEKSRLSFTANRDGWVRAIKDLGLQFDFVSTEQVVGQNRLTTGKYKILILPLALALGILTALVPAATSEAG